MISIEVVGGGGFDIHRCNRVFKAMGIDFFYVHRCENGCHSFQVGKAELADRIIQALGLMNAAYTVTDEAA